MICTRSTRLQIKPPSAILVIRDLVVLDAIHGDLLCMNPLQVKYFCVDGADELGMIITKKGNMI